MKTNHTPATSNNRPHNLPRRRRWYAPIGLAMALTASACGNMPFAGGTETSTNVAAVDVEGIDDARLSSASADEDDNGTSSQASSAASTTAAPSTDSDETTTTTAPAPVPTETVDDRFVGRSANYVIADVELGSVITTDRTPQDYLNGVDGELDNPVILIEVNLTSINGASGWFDREIFALVDSSGTRFSPTDVYTPRADATYSIDIESQATTKLVFVFDAIDLDGASFVASEAGRVPAIIPLTDVDTTQESPYTFDVSPAAVARDIEGESPWPSCTYAFSATIESATATLDGRNGTRIERTPIGERFVTFRVALTNTTTSDAGNCYDIGGNVDDVQPRLEIDGVAMAPTYDGGFEKVEVGATVTAEYVFRVPAGQHDLVLRSSIGSELGSWTVDIPPVAGE